MGIDRIGKGGAPPVPDAPGGVDKADRKGAVDAPFHVDRPQVERSQAERAGAAAAANAVNPASPLARLRAGEIDVDGYLDLKVEEAMRPLEGLPPADLADIRSALREQFSTDSAFLDLVRAATGSVPRPSEDG